jgi:uncharacterized protein
MPAETRTETGYPTREYRETREEQVDEKTWGIFSHLSLLTYLFGGVLAFLGPMIMWLVGKDKSPVIEQHAKSALNFGITVSIIALVLWILGPVMAFTVATAIPGLAVVLGAVVTLGWIVLFVFWLVFMILGTVSASKGEVYKYPVSFRFVN